MLRPILASILWPDEAVTGFNSVSAAAAAPELLLHEAAAVPGPVRPDGLVPLHIIRPGIGKGRGRHLYEADMLQREVSKGRFKGWKMYLDHLSPDAKKRASGLPRSIRDLAGQVKEAWWDPHVPANPRAGHGKGAVVGLATVNRFMRALIEDLPEAVGASISATATSVRPVSHGGQTAWLVEGINDRGSVDFVTEAGAGGRVISLVEALEESLADDQEVMAVLEEAFEGKSDRDIVELLDAEGLLDRPGLRTALLEAVGDGNDDEPDGDADDFEKRVKKHLPKFRGNRKMAEKAARKEMQESIDEGGDMLEELQEALESDDGQALLEAQIAPVVEKCFAKIVAPKLAELFESMLEDERELMQAESNASAQRMIELRDTRDMAHAKINEAALPEAFKTELRSKYQLAESGQPTPALDVADDDPAEVAEPKTAKAKVAEAVAADLALKEEQFKASRPTASVRGQGPRRDVEKKRRETPEGGDGDEGGESGGGDKVEEAASAFGGRTAFVLQEAGVELDPAMYDGILNS